MSSFDTRNHVSDACLAEIAAIASSIVGNESSHTLIAELELQLRGMHALPAQLYLLDESRSLLYFAAGLGGPSNAEDIPLENLDVLLENDNGVLPLRCDARLVGVLQVPRPRADFRRVQLLATLLGPALVGAQQQEVTLSGLRQVNEQVRQVVQAGALLRHLDLDVLLVQILQTLIDAVGAQVGSIVLAEEDHLQPKVSWGLHDDHLQAIRTKDGELLIDVVYRENKACKLGQRGIENHLDVSGLQAHLTSLLILPLSGHKQRHGLVFLANPEAAFTDDVQRLAVTICDMATIALDNVRLIQDTVDRERMHQELEIATKVQASMFPQSSLTHPRCAILGASRSCDETGGDYFTHLEHDGQIYAMIGDVTGHGLGAALYTTMAHAVIQLELRSGVDVIESASGLNRALGFCNSERFMTAALVSIDPETLRFSYVSAGHNPLLWFHRGEAIWLDSTCMPLGILPDMPCEVSETLQMAPGDYLFLYTDGFVEARSTHSEELYGEDRMCACLLQALSEGFSVARAIDTLFDDVESWMRGASHTDDLTIVGIAIAEEEGAREAAT